jgi:hypothetical protein
MVDIVGGVFVPGICTVRVKLEIVVLVPSLTETLMIALPVMPGAGVTVTVRFWSEPPSTMFAFGTSVVAVETAHSVRFAADVSASLIVNGSATVDCPGATVCAGIVEIVGGVFVGAVVTVSKNALLVVLVPSLTLTVIVAEPVLPATGVTVTVRSVPLPPNTMFAAGTNVVEEEVPETVRLAAAVSASPIVNGIAVVVWPEVVV